MNKTAFTLRDIGGLHRSIDERIEAALSTPEPVGNLRSCVIDAHAENPLLFNRSYFTMKFNTGMVILDRATYCLPLKHL